MSLYTQELQSRKSKFRLDYGTSQSDRRMYTAFYETRTELVMELKTLLTEFTYFEITKLITDETI